MNDLPSILFLIPFLSALLCAGVGFFVRSAPRWIATAALAAEAVVAAIATQEVFSSGTLRSYLGGWRPPVGIEFVLDPLAALMAFLVAVVAFVLLVGYAATHEKALEDRLPAFYSCALLLISGLQGIVVTGDLFNLFVHLEVASLSAYALVACGGKGAPKAAMRYLIIGSLGASFYLLGVGFLYAGTGSLNMADVAGIIARGDVSQGLMATAATFIFVGFGIKMALFPFHGWIATAYGAAPAPSSALMAPLVTKVSAYALLRVLFFVYGTTWLIEEEMVLALLRWTGAIAVVYGAVMAMLQDSLWRLFAFSSVSQIGVVAVGIGLATETSLYGSILHIANDALMKGAMFLAVGAVFTRFGARRVSELAGLGRRAPGTSAVFAITGLSLVGIPPLCGFFGKWYVLSGAVAEEAWILAAAIILGGLGSAGYVIRVLEQIYFVEAPEGAENRPLPAGTPWIVGAGVALTAMVVALGVFNAAVVRTWIQPALPPGL